LGGTRAPQRHTIARGSFCLWDLTAPPAASFHDGFSTIRLHLPFAALTEFAVSMGARASGLERMQPGTNDPILHHLFSCLAPAFQSPEDANPLFVDHIAMAIQIHLLQHYGGGLALSRGRGGLAGWQVRRAQEAMAANLGGGFSLDELARECGLSSSHFARAFRQSTGLPPHRWFNAKRLDTAKDLLLNSSLSLAEVALASGFSDQSHLTRAFTRAVGSSPASWRRSHGGPAIRGTSSIRQA
ncbi:MAG: helix-turn-helix transcriptional regulator, partial [Rhizobiaceae bacterium]|nr:helix-turn-helix transcriptional regulator [Rhizobiaceae bacterium]